MDESKDHDDSSRAAAIVSGESTVTVTTTVITSTSTTETVIEEIVEGGENEEQGLSLSEKEDGGACEEGGDVMVEVLGSEVLFDGVRRQSGEVGSGEGANLGDGDGGGRDGCLDSAVPKDLVVDMQHHDSGLRGPENLASGGSHDSVSGGGDCRKVDDSAVPKDLAVDMQQKHDLGTRQAENLACGPSRESVSGSGDGGKVDDLAVPMDLVVDMQQQHDVGSCKRENPACGPSDENFIGGGDSGKVNDSAVLQDLVVDMQLQHDSGALEHENLACRPTHEGVSGSDDSGKVDDSAVRKDLVVDTQQHDLTENPRSGRSHESVSVGGDNGKVDDSAAPQDVVVHTQQHDSGENLASGPNHESVSGDGDSGKGDDSADPQDMVVDTVDDSVVLQEVAVGMLQHDSGSNELENPASGPSHEGVSGDGDSGKVDDSAVSQDLVVDMQQHDSGSCGPENQAIGPSHEIVSGRDSTVATNEGSQDVKAHDIDTEKHVETGAEEALERRLGEEEGETDTRSVDNGAELHENSSSQTTEVRSNEIENGILQSTLEKTSLTDENRVASQPEKVESTKEETVVKNNEVLECTSVASQSSSKEQVVSMEGNEQGISEPSTHAQGDDLLDGKVNSGTESVEAPNRGDGSRHIDSNECLSLRSGTETVVKEQMQDPSVEAPASNSDVLHKTGVLIDSVTQDMENVDNELADMQAQVSMGEDNSADNANVMHMNADAMVTETDDMVCKSVDDQKLVVMSVKIDEKTVNQSAGDDDKIVVNEEPEGLAGGTDTSTSCTLTSAIRDKVMVNEEPEDSAGGTETGNVSKLTAVTSEVRSEIDRVVQLPHTEEKPVTCSEVDQNLKTECLMQADLRSSDVSCFSCIEVCGSMDMEVKDTVPKCETLQCVKDEKSNDYDKSSDPSSQNHVHDFPVAAVGFVDASGVPDDTKDVKGFAMEIDDDNQSPVQLKGVEDNAMEICDVTESENQNVHEESKLGDIENNGDLQSHLECPVEETPAVETDIAAVDTNSEKQGTTVADENPRSVEGDPSVQSLYSTVGPIVRCNFTRNSASSDKTYEPDSSCVADIIEPVFKDSASPNEDETTRLPDLVTSVDLGKEVMEDEDKTHKMDEKLNMGSPVLQTEVPDVSIAGGSVLDSDASQRQDVHGESEGRAAHEQPIIPDDSLVKCVDQGMECESDTLLGDEVDDQAANTEQVVSVGNASSDEDAVTKLHDPVSSALSDKQVMESEGNLHKVDEMLNTGQPEVSSECSPEVDLDAASKQDGIEEFEGHAAHEQPLPDESLVEVVDQRLGCEADTSVGECLDQSSTDGIARDASNVEDIQKVQEEADAVAEQVDLPEQPEVDEEQVSDSAKSRSKEEKNARRVSGKPGSLVRDHQVGHLLPPENEGEFSVFDLVWGKVKSHPWWPGQIFHPSDSSEKAMKYYRKDCYLVAYFGDRSFAWNEASVLKPFRRHFSQEEKQSNSEAFQNAVRSALAEVSRRVELGLACSCISDEATDKIRYQIVENAGIREESRKRDGIDRSTGAESFQPDKLLEYVRALALSPSTVADRLDLVIAKAQLLAFSRLKGCDVLPEFQYYDGLLECDDGTSFSRDQDSVAGGDGKTRLKGPNKRKHNLKDIVYQRRKEKSLTELMGESMCYLDGDFDSHEEDDVFLSSPTSGMKRKASGYLTDDFTSQQSTKTISFAKVSHTASSNTQQSFKVGECIRRVASQLTGSPLIMKSGGDDSDKQHLGDDVDEVIDAPEDSMTEETMIAQKPSSLDEMLSQLHLCARDPMKGYSFLTEIISFFSEFRNLAVSTQRQIMRKGHGRKRKPSSVPNVGPPPESFEFDDRNDSYWTDMVVQNNPEAKPSRRGRKRKDEQLLSADPEKPLQSNPRKYSRKQYFHGNHESSAAEIPSGEDKKQDQLPTELMLNFIDVGSVPSEVNLNKMFRRFGSLKESETQVDTQSSRARVVFKKRSDAEVAYSSAAMFNIFGSTLVNYQLNYTPSVSFRTSSLQLTNGQEDAQLDVCTT